MDKFIEKTEMLLSPIASKISNNKFLVAIRNSFAGIGTIVATGSLALLLNAIIVDLPGRFGSSFLAEKLSFLVTINNLVFKGSIGIVSLAFAISVGFNVAKLYEVESLPSSLISLSSFIISLGITTFNNISLESEGHALIAYLKNKDSFFEEADLASVISNLLRESYFDTKGYFGALIIGFLSTIIFCKLIKKKFVLKLPSSIPPMVGDAFTSLIPGAVSLYSVAVLTYVLNKITGKNLIGLVYKFIQIPLLSFSQNIFIVVFIGFIVQFFWFFGIHGGNLFFPFMEGLFGVTLLVNMEAHMRGQEIPYFWNSASYSAFVWYGVLGLLIVNLLFSKNPHYKEVAKMGIGPCIFNIGETVMYGLPTVMNKFLLVPFLLCPSVLSGVSYLATSLGWVDSVTQSITWVIPPVLHGFLSTGFDWRAIILSLVNIGISILVYWPFVKMADKEDALLNNFNNEENL